MRSWWRFALPATGWTLAVVAGGWPWVDGSGRTGLLVAAGAALPLHLGLYGIQLRQERGTPGFLAVWAGGAFLRMLVVGAVAGVVWVRDDVDALAAMLALVGLLMGLLFLEVWAMQSGDDGPMNENEGR